jgi:UPF0716 protein FxsA
LIRLILLFTLLPLVELSLLLRIGEWLGLAPTLGIVIATGIAGAWLARREGLRTWAAVRRELAAGRLPGDELVHALLILAAGIVLVTPGVLTDGVGLLLLVPPVRAAAVRTMRRRFAGRVQLHVAGIAPEPGGLGTEEPPPGSATDGDREGRRIIEV